MGETVIGASADMAKMVDAISTTITQTLEKSISKVLSANKISSNALFNFQRSSEFTSFKMNKINEEIEKIHKDMSGQTKKMRAESAEQIKNLTNEMKGYVDTYSKNVNEVGVMGGKVNAKLSDEMIKKFKDSVKEAQTTSEKVQKESITFSEKMADNFKSKMKGVGSTLKGYWDSNIGTFLKLGAVYEAFRVGVLDVIQDYKDLSKSAINAGVSTQLLYNQMRSVASVTYDLEGAREMVMAFADSGERGTKVFEGLKGTMAKLSSIGLAVTSESAAGLTVMANQSKAGAEATESFLVSLAQIGNVETRNKAFGELVEQARGMGEMGPIWATRTAQSFGRVETALKGIGISGGAIRSVFGDVANLDVFDASSPMAKFLLRFGGRKALIETRQKGAGGAMKAMMRAATQYQDVFAGKDIIKQDMVARGLGMTKEMREIVSQIAVAKNKGDKKSLELIELSYKAESATGLEKLKAQKKLNDMYEEQQAMSMGGFAAIRYQFKDLARTLGASLFDVERDEKGKVKKDEKGKDSVSLIAELNKELKSLANSDAMKNSIASFRDLFKEAMPTLIASIPMLVEGAGQLMKGFAWIAKTTAEFIGWADKTTGVKGSGLTMVFGAWMFKKVIFYVGGIMKDIGWFIVKGISKLGWDITKNLGSKLGSFALKSLKSMMNFKSLAAGFGKFFRGSILTTMIIGALERAWSGKTITEKLVGAFMGIGEGLVTSISWLLDAGIKLVTGEDWDLTGAIKQRYTETIDLVSNHFGDLMRSIPEAIGYLWEDAKGALLDGVTASAQGVIDFIDSIFSHSKAWDAVNEGIEAGSNLDGLSEGAMANAERMNQHIMDLNNSAMVAADGTAMAAAGFQSAVAASATNMFSGMTSAAMTEIKDGGYNFAMPSYGGTGGVGGFGMTGINGDANVATTASMMTAAANFQGANISGLNTAAFEQFGGQGARVSAAERGAELTSQNVKNYGSAFKQLGLKIDGGVNPSLVPTVGDDFIKGLSAVSSVRPDILKKLHITSGYRTYEEQMKLWKEHPERAGKPSATGSHTHGGAIDIGGLKSLSPQDQYQFLSIMSQSGIGPGQVRLDGRFGTDTGEHWHFERVKRGGAAGGGRGGQVVGAASPGSLSLTPPSRPGTTAPASASSVSKAAGPSLTAAAKPATVGTMPSTTSSASYTGIRASTAVATAPEAQVSDNSDMVSELRRIEMLLQQLNGSMSGVAEVGKLVARTASSDKALSLLHNRQG
jgi:hypothetical protein